MPQITVTDPKMSLELTYFQPITVFSFQFVGYAGALGAIAGFTSSILVGCYVDKTKQFKEVIKLSSVAVAMVAILINLVSFLLFNPDLTLFSLQYLRHKNTFWYDSYLLGSLMVLLGLFSIPAYPISLELGIETTYPIAEATSSGVLTIASQILLFLTSFIINKSQKLSWIYPVNDPTDNGSDSDGLMFKKNYQCKSFLGEVTGQ